MRKVTPDTGLYLHLPFCLSRCGYCDFAVVTDRDDSQEDYVGRLENEIGFWAPRLHRPLVSVYFGGGTPSRLSPPLWNDLIETLRKKLALAEGAEITAEANPESLSEEILDEWRSLGINRISLGVQTFDPQSLLALDRRHTREKAEEVLRSLPRHGFDNWSLDLIYGLPHQSLEDWKQDLDTALGFDPPHVSFYNLILHPNLPATLKALEDRTPDRDERDAELFLWATDTLAQAGYEVYELSNAARPGKRSVHNSLYWRGGEWIGLGLSAASYFQGEYFSNPASWQAYQELWRQPPASDPHLRKPCRSDERLLDTVMLRLRTVEGLELAELEDLLANRPLPESLLRLKDDLIRNGLLRDRPDRLAPTPRGWLVHSEMVERIVRTLENEGSHSPQG